MKIRDVIDWACLPGMFLFSYYALRLYERNELIAAAVLLIIGTGCEVRFFWHAFKDNVDA